MNKTLQAAIKIFLLFLLFGYPLGSYSSDKLGPSNEHLKIDTPTYNFSSPDARIYL